MVRVEKIDANTYLVNGKTCVFNREVGSVETVPFDEKLSFREHQCLLDFDAKQKNKPPVKVKSTVYP
jgi:hypothetical protein